MDCSPPCSSVHGIFQARVLEWVGISFSRGSSLPKDRTHISRIVSKMLYRLSHQGSPVYGSKSPQIRRQMEKNFINYNEFKYICLLLPRWPKKISFQKNIGHNKDFLTCIFIPFILFSLWNICQTKRKVPNNDSFGSLFSIQLEIYMYFFFMPLISGMW